MFHRNTRAEELKSGGLAIVVKAFVAIATLGLNVVSPGESLARNVAEDPLQILEKIDVMTPQVAESDPMKVRYELTNAGEKAIRVLKWNTPLEQHFYAPMLVVAKDGKAVPYIGKIVKRGGPQGNDFIEIGAHETVHGELELTEGYLVFQEGNYKVKLPRRALSVLVPPPVGVQAKGRLFRVLAKVETSINDTVNLSVTRASPKVHFALKLNILGAADLVKAKPKVPAIDAKTCNAVQRTGITAALPHASQLAVAAFTVLNGTVDESGRMSDQRYAKWFGAYSAVRYASATTHFQKIQSVLVNETVRVTCDCNEQSQQSWFAYVQPGNPYLVHVCPQFWAAAIDGADSRAGTLIHEISHFSIVAGTLDHVYGQQDAARIAASNPDEALNNADNHEYYAENSP